MRSHSNHRHTGDTIVRFVAAIGARAPPRPYFVAVRMRQIAVLTFFYTKYIASHHPDVYSGNCLLHVSS
ncbi:hypothetical protein E4F39_18730 [Burkholderia pseudomallei]|nr:hypothetical protein [Burkholderia pseudomallei]MPT69392.1 hypothetical protein [Burkholderia pseudomallei]MPT75168.1 hypothetical protein [Burkholderia pseudomallei]MPT82024.1 hypothetical protein [Burkholderia pseudomallei]MPT88164.1 hypothetical protein [Burkholderia pseudomallei]